jgi:hypothetical protein
MRGVQGGREQAGQQGGGISWPRSARKLEVPMSATPRLSHRVAVLPVGPGTVLSHRHPGFMPIAQARPAEGRTMTARTTTV